VLARGDEFEVVEGSSRGRPFVIEFPSYVAAKECFESDGYQGAIKLREGNASFDIVVAQGFTPQLRQPASAANLDLAAELGGFRDPLRSFRARSAAHLAEACCSGRLEASELKHRALHLPIARAAVDKLVEERWSVHRDY